MKSFVEAGGRRALAFYYQACGDPGSGKFNQINHKFQRIAYVPLLKQNFNEKQLLRLKTDE